MYLSIIWDNVPFFMGECIISLWYSTFHSWWHLKSFHWVEGRISTQSEISSLQHVTKLFWFFLSWDQTIKTTHNMYIATPRDHISHDLLYLSLQITSGGLNEYIIHWMKSWSLTHKKECSKVIPSEYSSPVSLRIRNHPICKHSQVPSNCNQLITTVIFRLSSLPYLQRIFSNLISRWAISKSWRCCTAAPICLITLPTSAIQFIHFRSFPTWLNDSCAYSVL